MNTSEHTFQFYAIGFYSDVSWISKASAYNYGLRTFIGCVMVGHKMWLTGAKGEYSWRGIGTDCRYWYTVWQRVAFCVSI